MDFKRRPGKDLGAYNLGSSSELEGPIPKSVVSSKLIERDKWSSLRELDTFGHQ